MATPWATTNLSQKLCSPKEKHSSFFLFEDHIVRSCNLHDFDSCYDPQNFTSLSFMTTSAGRPGSIQQLTRRRKGKGVSSIIFPLPPSLSLCWGSEVTLSECSMFSPDRTQYVLHDYAKLKACCTEWIFSSPELPLPLLKMPWIHEW